MDAAVVTPRDRCPALSVHLVLQAQLSRQGVVALRESMARARVLSLSLSTDVEIKSPHIGSVNASSIEIHEYRYLLCAGSDGIVSLFDLDRSRPSKVRAGTHVIRAIAIKRPYDLTTSRGDALRAAVPIHSVQWFPSDNGIYMTATRARVEIWDAAELVVATSMQLPTSNPLQCASMESTAGKSSPLIAVGTEKRAVHLFDMVSGDTSHKLSGHTDGVSAVAWSPSCPYQLASGSSDGSIKLWDIRKANHHGLLMSFDKRQDHHSMVASGMKLTVDTESAHVPHQQQQWHIRQDDESLRKFKTIDWNRDDLARAHTGAVRCLRYSSCGRHVLSSGNDGHIRLWQTSNGQLLNINYDSGCKSEKSYQFEIASVSHRSADDLLLFPNGSNGHITVTPVHSHTGQRVRELRGHVAMVNSIVYRKPYQQIISCGRDRMIYLWTSPDMTKIPAIVHSDVSMPHHWWSRTHHHCHLHPQKQQQQKQQHWHDASGADDTFDDNRDAWSDEEESDLPADRFHQQRQRQGRGRRGRTGTDSYNDDPRLKRLRFFVPPIIQRYIDAASEPTSSIDAEPADAAIGTDVTVAITTATSSNVTASSSVPAAVQQALEVDSSKRPRTTKAKPTGLALIRQKFGAQSRRR